MSFSLAFKADRPFAVIRSATHVTGGELLEAIHHLRDHPQFAPECHEVWDFLGAESYDVSPNDIRRIAAVTLRPPIKRTPECRRAILLASKGAYGLGRMFEILTSSSPVCTKVFQDVESAHAWLDSEGVETPSLDSLEAALSR